MNHILPPIHHACSTDHLRPAMNCILIDNGIAIATNAHIMVLINLRVHSMLTPEQISNMNGKLIHMDTYQFLTQAHVINPSATQIHAVIKNSKCHFEYEPADLKFPDYKAVIKNYNTQPVASDGLGLNPSHMVTLKKVFGAASMGYQFMFYGEQKGMIIRPIGDKARYAVVMPMMMNGAEHAQFNTNLETE